MIPFFHPAISVWKTHFSLPFLLIFIVNYGDLSSRKQSGSLKGLFGNGTIIRLQSTPPPIVTHIYRDYDFDEDIPDLRFVTKVRKFKPLRGRSFYAPYKNPWNDEPCLHVYHRNSEESPKPSADIDQSPATVQEEPEIANATDLESQTVASSSQVEDTFNPPTTEEEPKPQAQVPYDYDYYNYFAEPPPPPSFEYGPPPPSYYPWFQPPPPPQPPAWSYPWAQPSPTPAPALPQPAPTWPTQPTAAPAQPAQTWPAQPAATPAPTPPQPAQTWPTQPAAPLKAVAAPAPAPAPAPVPPVLPPGWGWPYAVPPPIPPPVNPFAPPGWGWALPLPVPVKAKPETGWGKPIIVKTKAKYIKSKPVKVIKPVIIKEKPKVVKEKEKGWESPPTTPPPPPVPLPVPPLPFPPLPVPVPPAYTPLPGAPPTPVNYPYPYQGQAPPTQPNAPSPGTVSYIKNVWNSFVDYFKFGSSKTKVSLRGVNETETSAPVKRKNSTRANKPKYKVKGNGAFKLPLSVTFTLPSISFGPQQKEPGRKKPMDKEDDEDDDE